MIWDNPLVNCPFVGSNIDFLFQSFLSKLIGFLTTLKMIFFKLFSLWIIKHSCKVNKWIIKKYRKSRLTADVFKLQNWNQARTIKVINVIKSFDGGTDFKSWEMFFKNFTWKFLFFMPKASILLIQKQLACTLARTSASILHS